MWSVGVAVEQSVIVAVVKQDDNNSALRRRIRMVDRHLSNGNFKLAVKHLHPSITSGFSAATQIPPRVVSVEQLHLSVTETSTLQSLLDAINSTLQSSLLQESHVTGEDGDLYKQVVQHEAGHFLVGYLLGVLPKHYTFSTMEDKLTHAKVKFVGFEFLKELEDVAMLPSKNLQRGRQASKSKLSSTVIRKFACVIVGGLVAEHLAFGYSKGHHGDVEKLDRVLKWQQFTEDEANILTRWAVLNTLTILHRHSKARSALAEAMLHGRSIGNCIHAIETNLNHQNI